MLDINPKDIPGSFTQIANRLFNDYLIQVNNSYYRLLELEFYYKDNDKHIDPYTHGHRLQNRSGFWYVHGSGIDITFGSKNIYGGILVRSIEKIQPTPLDKKINISSDH